jgi:hypothetical protein
MTRHCPNLRALKVMGIVHKGAIANMRTLNALDTLSLWMSKDAATCLPDILAHTPSLTSLTLFKPPRDFITSVIAKCPRLVSLSVHFVSLLTPSDLLSLSSLPLTTLELEPLTQLTLEHMQAITHIHALTRLHVRECDVAFTEAGACVLTQLPLLEDLLLGYSEQDELDENLKLIKRKSMTTITEKKAIRLWASLPSLTTLTLRKACLPDCFGIIMGHNHTSPAWSFIIVLSPFRLSLHSSLNHTRSPACT